MTHKTNTSKTAAAVVSVQLTQADAIGAKGQALSNTRIYIIDANGVPTGAIMESGIAGAIPVSGGGGSGAPAIVPLWTAATALDAGAQVRATVAIGGFVVGEYISSNSSRTTGAAFDATEAGNFTSVPEDTTVLKKTDVVNVLTSTATDVPLSAAQGKALQDNKAALATTGTPAMDGTAALGVATTAAKSDHVHPSDTSRAPLVSPTFTGTIIADGLVKLGDGQNLPSPAPDVASTTHIFANSASTASSTITATDTAIRVSRAGTSGTKWNNTLDLNIGSHTAGLNSQTQVDFRLNNGGVATPDMTALTLRGDGQVLLNSNPTAALGAVTKQYADGLVAGLLDYRGAFTPAVASGATGYPTTGGSGSAGAILKGDVYFASAAGFILTEAIQAGDSVVAKIDSPGQTAANWDKLNVNISYVPEDAANKVTAFSSPTNAQYPSALLVSDQLAGKHARFVYTTAQDANNLVASGVHTSGSASGTLTNAPLGNSAWEVIVSNMVTGASTFIHQLYVTDNNDMYTRKRDNATTWTAWSKVVNGSLKTVGGIAIEGTGDIPFPTFATSLRLMNPTDIIEDANRAIYLLADDLALGAVSTWPNPGTGGDFLQATAGSQPTVVAVPALGNRRAALFADDFMETAANISLGTNYGLFAVFMITSLAETNQFILSEIYAGGTVEYTFGVQGSQFFAGHFNGAWRQHGVGTAVITTPYIMAASYNGANISIAIDGATATSTAQTSNPSLAEAGNIRLGRRWDGVADIFDGHIACVVAKSGAAFTATELAQLEGWAAWYYGRVSALPVGHTYKTVPPMITA